MKNRIPAAGVRHLIDARVKNPNAVEPSPSITAQYFRDINRLVRQMTQLVKSRVFPILDQYEITYAQTESGEKGFRVTDDDFGLALNAAFESIQDEFATLQKYATRIATNRMLQANQDNRKKFISTWKKTMGVNVGPLLSPGTRVYGKLIDRDTAVPVLDAIRANVSLIKTVPEQHLDKIQKAIQEGIKNGDDAFSLKGVISKVNDQNTRRAKLIARDQMQKLTGVLVQARQQSLGINGYIWETSHDERVRDSHKKNNGKKFQWNSPPRGTGHPGEDINCRCVAKPDLSQIIPSLAPELQPQGPRRVNRISV